VPEAVDRAVDPEPVEEARDRHRDDVGAHMVVTLPVREPPPARRIAAGHLQDVGVTGQGVLDAALAFHVDPGGVDVLAAELRDLVSSEAGAHRQQDPVAGAAVGDPEHRRHLGLGQRPGSGLRPLRLADVRVLHR
jgi:hypothetical protein